MKASMKWFIAAGVSGVVFLICVASLVGLEEEGKALADRISEHRGLLSSSNSTRYMKSFFDGLTMGAFAKEGIFTEVNNYDRETNSLKMECASWTGRVRGVELFRSVSLLGLIGCGIAGFVIRNKEMKKDGGGGWVR